MLIRLLFAFLLTMLSSGCTAHTVGGKSARDVFSDRQTRQFADAACQGNVQRIEKLVKSGLDINGQGLEGASPLLWAISCENQAGVKALLDNGANPNLQMTNGMSPVTTSATYDNPIFLKHVLQAGGDPNAERDHAINGIALALAFERGIDLGDDWTNYQLLLDAGADINKLSKRGDGLSDFIWIFGRFCKIQELLNAGYNQKLPGLLVSSYKRSPGNTDSREACRQNVIKRLRNELTEQDIQAAIDGHASRIKLPPERYKLAVDGYAEQIWRIYRDE